MTLVVCYIFLLFDWYLWFFFQNEVNKKVIHNGVDRSRMAFKDDFDLKHIWARGLCYVKSLCCIADVFRFCYVWKT
jgi:hypothetical protein